MSWRGDPGSWRTDEPPAPAGSEVVRQPLSEAKLPEPRPGLDAWMSAVLDELEKPGAGVFGARALTGLVAVGVCFLLIEQADSTALTFATLVGLAVGWVVYTGWPLLSGGIWDD